MSASEDIRNLFGKFEGQTQQYQEVTRDDQAVEARSRWPLLSSVALNETDRVPDVADTSAHAPDFDALHGGDSSSGTWHARVASEGVAAARAATSSSTPNPAPSSLRGALFGARPAQPVQQGDASGAAAEPLRVAPAPASAPASAQVSSASSASSSVSSASSSGLSSYGSAEPTGPTSAFAPPRAPGPRPAPLPFLRDAAPAFHVHTGPAGRASAGSPSTSPSTSPLDVAPAVAAPVAPVAPVATVATVSPMTPTTPAPVAAAPLFAATPSVAAPSAVQSTAARVDSPPPVLRRGVPAASVTPFSTAPALSVQSPTPSEPPPSSLNDSAFPPVVTPETSKRRALHSRDFAPPVVPVNHYKPSAAPITGVEAELDYGALRAGRQPGAIPSGSILGKLFAPAVPTPAYEEAPPAHAGSRDLQSVFGRLAGGAGGGADRGEGA